MAVKAHEGYSRNGPLVILVSMLLDPDPDLSRTVWWLYVHQFPHVKQSHAQASSTKGIHPNIPD